MKKDSSGLQGSFSGSWRRQKEGSLPKNEEMDTDQCLRLAAYVRLSPSGEEREEGSLVSHPQRIKDFVSWKNRQTDGKWGKIAGFYVDKDQSGKDLNRPGFQKMCADIEKGMIDGVVVTELSRLSRKVKDFCHVWDFLKENNVKFISLKENFDTSTPMGELMLIQAISFAQFERETIVERIKNGSRARAERGLANGGVLCLGYDIVPEKANHRKINEEERPYVQMIFKKMLELKKMSVLLKYLGDNGYKTKEYTTKSGVKKGGKRWVLSSLHKVLTNRAYIGQREFNKKNKFKDQETLKNKDRYFFTKAQWPAIVDEDIFFDVQRILELNKKKARKYTYNYILTGLVKCPECGVSFCGKSAKGKNSKFFYYGHIRKMKTEGNDHLKRCHIENVPAPQLEQLILEQLKILGRDRKLIATLVAESHTGESEKHASLKSLILSKENKRRTLVNKMDNIVDTIGNTTDKTTRKILTESIPSLEEQRHQVTKEIAKLCLELTEQKENIVDARAVFTLLSALNKELEISPPQARILLLEEIIREIVVYEDRVRLSLYGAADVVTGLERPLSGRFLQDGKSGGESVGSSFRIRNGWGEGIRTPDQ